MKNLFSFSKKIVLILVALTSIAEQSFAADLETRVSYLERRVQELYDGFKPCLSKVDGIAPRGTRELLKNSNNEWVISEERTSAAFQIEILKQFALPNGHAAASVRLSAPGYGHACSIKVFSANDIVLN